jgi:hypothetical protein
MKLFTENKKKEKTIKKPKKIPFGIQILSYIYMLAIIISLVIAGILFFNHQMLSALPGFDPNAPQTVIYIIAGFLVFFSGLSGYIAFGIRKGSKTARGILISLLILNVIGGVISIVNSQNQFSWINISLNSIAILYLFLNKKAKAFFK